MQVSLLAAVVEAPTRLNMLHYNVYCRFLGDEVPAVRLYDAVDVVSHLTLFLSIMLDFGALFA